MITTSVCIAVFRGLFSSQCANRDAAYEQKTTFTKDSKVRFPDFELTFLGTRKVSSEQFAPGFTFYDFRIASTQTTLTVSSSSGTGDIGPTEFEVDGTRFLLELRIFDRLGRLGENELVITKKPGRR